MIISRKSIISGKIREMDLPVTQEQLDQCARKEALVQVIFPDLTNEQREFIMTGITAEEWNQHIVVDEEDDSEDDESAF